MVSSSRVRSTERALSDVFGGMCLGTILVLVSFGSGKRRESGERGEDASRGPRGGSLEVEGVQSSLAEGPESVNGEFEESMLLQGSTITSFSNCNKLKNSNLNVRPFKYKEVKVEDS